MFPSPVDYIEILKLNIDRQDKKVTKKQCIPLSVLFFRLSVLPYFVAGPFYVLHLAEFHLGLTIWILKPHHMTEEAFSMTANTSQGCFDCLIFDILLEFVWYSWRAFIILRPRCMCFLLPLVPTRPAELLLPQLLLFILIFL